jgi:hypothetical protein
MESCRLVLSFTEGEADLPDPFGCDLATYRATFERLRGAIDVLLE